MHLPEQPTEQDTASADVLETPPTTDVAADEVSDPMSGYTSADAIELPQGGPSHVDPVRDRFSGYASADELEPRL